MSFAEQAMAADWSPKACDWWETWCGPLTSFVAAVTRPTEDEIHCTYLDLKLRRKGTRRDHCHEPILFNLAVGEEEPDLEADPLWDTDWTKAGTSRIAEPATGGALIAEAAPPAAPVNAGTGGWGSSRSSRGHQRLGSSPKVVTPSAALQVAYAEWLSERALTVEDCQSARWQLAQLKAELKATEQYAGSLRRRTRAARTLVNEREEAARLQAERAPPCWAQYWPPSLPTASSMQDGFHKLTDLLVPMASCCRDPPERPLQGGSTWSENLENCKEALREQVTKLAAEVYQLMALRA